MALRVENGWFSTLIRWRALGHRRTRSRRFRRLVSRMWRGEDPVRPLAAHFGSPGAARRRVRSIADNAKSGRHRSTRKKAHHGFAGARLTRESQPVISTGWHRLTDPSGHRLTGPDSTGWPAPKAQVGRPQNPPKQEHRSTCTKFNQGTSTCNFCVSVRADL